MSDLAQGRSGSLLRFNPIRGFILEDAGRPCPEAGWVAEFAESFGNCDPGFLEQFGGRIRIAGDPVGSRGESWCPEVDELCDRFFAAGVGLKDQILTEDVVAIAGHITLSVCQREIWVHESGVKMKNISLLLILSRFRASNHTQMGFWIVL